MQTRAQKEKEKRKVKPLRMSEQIPEISLVDIKQAQSEDESLIVPRRMSKSGEQKVFKNGSAYWYVEEGVLYRKFQSENVEHSKAFKQLVVPKDYRKHVLRLGHDSILSRHLGIKKMTDKILSEFHWPGVQGDVIRYCRSCDVCQRTFP